MRSAAGMQSSVMADAAEVAQAFKQKLTVWYSHTGKGGWSAEDKQSLLDDLKSLRQLSHDSSDACLLSDLLCAAW